MILSISGKIDSGKDTTGKIMQILIDSPHFDNKAVKSFLEREMLTPSFTIEKWGGVLKDITCLLISCTREQLEDEEFKNKELGRDWRQYFITDANNHRINTKKYISEREVQEELEKLCNSKLRYDYDALTPRLLMQYLGTECGRNIIHPNIWVNALMSKYVDKHALSTWGHETLYPNWIITDTRFPNELKAVIDKSGINIRINRNNGTRAIDINSHESETALDNATFDYYISNDSTLEILIDNVRLILQMENILKSN